MTSPARFSRFVVALAMALVVGCSLAMVRAPALAAQAVARPIDAEIERIQTALQAGRYAEARQRGNLLLETARAISRGEQVQIWQLLAAAYYPRDARAQRPDSARVPLDALVHVAPDVRLPAAITWPGLDSLLERARRSVFVVVARPPPMFTASLGEPARVAVVATRPALFRLTTVERATGVAVTHDSAAAGLSAELQLRVHDGQRALLAPGAHDLRTWALDLATGDSTVVIHELVATPAQGVSDAPPLPDVPSTQIAGGVPSKSRAPTVILSGLAFAGASVAIAHSARADGPIRTGYQLDERALVVAGAMLGAALASVFVDRVNRRRQHATASRALAARAEAIEADAHARTRNYRVQLRIGPPMN